MKKYLIGIDGGASRSKGVLVDGSGQMLSAADGGGLNPLSGGWDQFSVNFSELINKLLEKTPADAVDALCAGLAGAGSAELCGRAQREIAALFPAATIYVISDAQAALWGAFRGAPGLLLIAGTGSICVGCDERGNTARSGGFGRILGDEGGGYWVAVEAIKKALLHLDGRASAALLLETVRTEFGQELFDLTRNVHSGKIQPDRIAKLAKRILAISDQDAAARDIVKRAGEYLADLIISTAEKLQQNRPQVALWGGLWNSPGQQMQRSLGAALKNRGFTAKICQPAEPPEWGAVRYLLKHLK